MKDHEIAALVNELRDTAIKYAGTQQLRERIAHIIVPVAERSKKLQHALERVRLRCFFIGWPTEAMWNVGTEEVPRWVPDWRHEIQLIENVLNGGEIRTPENPTDTMPANQLPNYKPQKELNSYELMKVVMVADETLVGRAIRGTTNWAAAIGKAVQAAVTGKAVPKGDIKDLQNVHDWLTIDTLNERVSILQEKLNEAEAKLKAYSAYVPSVDVEDSEICRLTKEVERLNAIINTPQSNDFLRATSTEAEHQRQRWGSKHDAGKTQADWYWLIGYLAGKALYANLAGDTKKAEHHIITTAAVLLNWHLSMFGGTDMRLGIDPAKVDVDYCTDPNNCNRCMTHPDHRGNMEHAGIGKRPDDSASDCALNLCDPKGSHEEGCSLVTNVGKTAHDSVANFPDIIDTVSDILKTSRAHAISVMRSEVVPDDFFSHKDAWRNAIAHAKESSVIPDDKSYWQHELNAFDRAYRDLEKP